MRQFQLPDAILQRQVAYATQNLMILNNKFPMFRIS